MRSCAARCSSGWSLKTNLPQCQHSAARRQASPAVTVRHGRLGGLGQLLVVPRGAAPFAAPVVPPADAGHGRREVGIAGAVRDESCRPVRGRRCDALVRRPGVQLGTAVGQQVVVPGHALVPGPRQVAGGGEDRGPVGEHRPGQRVAVGAGDERAADPGHAALVPAPVRHRDEYPIGGRRGLRLDHLGGPLPGRPAVARPVHRGRDQVGAVQGDEPRPLGELQVVTDHHGHPPELGLHHRRRGVAGGERDLLVVPQVRLAVDRPGAGRVHQGRAVVQAAVGAELAETADDHQPVPAGQRLPLPQGGAVGNGRGQAAGLGGRVFGVEDIAGVGQLGQYHEPSARGGRLGDRLRGGLPVRVRFGHGDGELSDGYLGGVHYARSVRPG